MTTLTLPITRRGSSIKKRRRPLLTVCMDNIRDTTVADLTACLPMMLLGASLLLEAGVAVVVMRNFNLL
ncbi:MAG: hypothetical protein KGJ41_03425 [Rhodospirillales bacterium]|nr:hypothetical protein [Rhodospirillales bacterium]MDE2574350.1 hypothetical protein [Rhodospirillales bacterium]